MQSCMQDTFARATHSAGRPSAARDDRVYCIQDAKPRTFRLVKDLFSRMNESEYEVMQLKQSTV